MAWARVLRLADSVADTLRSIRLARPDFLSALSSEPVGEETENGIDWSRLEVDRRLLTDDGRMLLGELACVEGGREEDSPVDDFGGSIVIDLRLSALEVRRSLIRSFTIVMEDLRPFLLSFFELDRRLCRIESFLGGEGTTTAF